jgi:hypothetical protein
MARARKPTTYFATAKLDGAGKLLAKMPDRFGPRPKVFDDLKLKKTGRPPKYEHADIVAVAEEAIKNGIDDTAALFADRVGGLLDLRHIEVPRRTVLTAICAPIYKQAKFEK